MQNTQADLESFRVMLLGQLAELEGHRRVLVKSPSAAIRVHKMRVGTRRVREALALLKHASGEELVSEWIRRTRKVTRALGECRSLDVSRAILKREFSRTDPRAAARVSARLAEKRRKESRRLLERLERFKAKKLRKAVKKLLKKERERLGRSWLESGLDRLGRHEAEIGRRLPRGGALKKARLHELRIGIKKMRYHLEILSRAGGMAYGRRLEALKRRQRLLGRWHDYEVLKGHVRATSPGGRASKKDLRALLERVSAREESAARVVRAFAASKKERA